MLGKILDFIKSKIVLIIIIIVILVLVIWILSMVGNKSSKGSSYDQVSLIMENSARRYYKDKPDELPKKNGETVVIEEKKLVSLQYMESTTSIINKEGISCSGKVSVTNLNGNYRYTPNLNCGDNYSTVTFIDKVKEDSSTSTGDGLYDLNGYLVFRGEHVNNYAKINEKLYRIVRIRDNKIYLVNENKLEQLEWDDRYNIEKKSDSGINDFSVSRIKEKLDEMYDSDKLFTENDKLMITSQTLNVGKRKLGDIDTDGSIESSSTLDDQYLGMLTVNDYVNASLDTNCKKSDDISCINYNYLAKSASNYWLLTADAETTYRVFKYNLGSGLTTTKANTNAYIRIVVALTGDTLYVSGDGTLENPYIMK